MHRPSAQAISALLALATLLSAASAQSPAGQLTAAGSATQFPLRSSNARLWVDVQDAAGLLKPLRGVNGAPDLTFLGPVGPRGEPRVNVTAGYRAAHVNLVRTHDADGLADIDPHIGGLPPLIPPAGGPAALALDRNVIFPNLQADPDRADSYRFGPTDQLVLSIRALGADVLFRLGRDAMTTAPAPKDLNRYASIVRHIVLHYERGWDHGLHDSVKYWEVWNEPDLGQIWWRGTPEQYDALYGAVARAVKSADPDSLVGGPTIAMVNERTPYREGFLDYVRMHRLPLDFFSWHWYSVGSNDPYDFNVIGTRLRSLLDREGFTRTQSILDEWNYDFRVLRTAPPLQVATFVASALAYMQDSAIDQSALYRADGDFLASGAPRTPTGQVLIDEGRFADTPERLRTAGADTVGLAVQAGRSTDGRLVRALVSNYEIPAIDQGPRPGGDEMKEDHRFTMRLLPRRIVHYPRDRRYHLTVAGLSAGRYELTHWRLDSTGQKSDASTLTVSGGALQLDFDLPPYVVDSFELKRLTAGAAPSAVTVRKSLRALSAQ